jgi:hypothetical protein
MTNVIVNANIEKAKPLTTENVLAFIEGSEQH